MNEISLQEITEDVDYYQSIYKALDRTQALIEFDTAGNILRANQIFLDLMGYTAEEIYHQHHRIFCLPNYIESVEYLNFWRHLAQGQISRDQFVRLTKDGRQIWLQASYNPVFDAKGNVVRIVKFATDITQSKLHNAEYKGMIDAMDRSTAIIEFDLRGTILAANGNFLRAMGYTADEIIGKHHSLFCSPEQIQSSHYRDFWADLSEGKFQSGRFKRIGKHGVEVWIQASYNPIFDLSGNPYKVVKFSYDISGEVNKEIEISVKIGNIKGSLDKLTLSTDKISSEAKATLEQSNLAILASSQGQTTLQRTLDSINEIQVSANKISEIVLVITEIANQSNMLAFNAAIEAARAGEHGTGFSVVADEVRKLAEKSTIATREISVVTSQALRMIEQGVRMSSSVTEAFDDISRAINCTTQSISHIQQSSDKQSEETHSVDSLLVELNAVARQK